MFFELLACVGLMFILKYGTILNTARSNLINKAPILEEVFNCSLCLGFWAGVIIGLFIIITNFTAQAFLLPFASAAVCWVADNINNLIQTINMLFEE